MGQYYDILLKRENYEHYEHYGSSVDGVYVPGKLMEHSWWENAMLGAVCRLIYEMPAKIFWVGDYADKADSVNGMTESEILKIYRLCYGNGSLERKTLSGKDLLVLDDKFLVDHTKQEYIDCTAYFDKSLDENGWAIHPLSLMTAIGNGPGGDYRGVNEERVGEWAGDLISVENTPPENFKKNDVYFSERYVVCVSAH